MPEKVLKKINAYILPEWKVCFFISIAVGLLAHLYKITNWLPNWDSLVFRYDSQNMIALGRWFLPVVCSLSSFYDLPFLNGIIAILFHALSAVCICRMFDIRRKITAGLVGAMIVSFSSVTSIMMYNYVADGYSIAFFLAVLAAMYMTGEKTKYIFSSLLISLSTGIYQAYITVTIMLVLLKLIDEILYQNVSFGDVLMKVVRMLSAGILGVILYGVILKIILGVLSVQLLDYQGVNETASLKNINLISSLYVVRETFIKCFFDLSDGLNVYALLNIFIMSFTLVYYAGQIVICKIYKKPANVLMILFLASVLIPGAGALAFANAGVDYHNLMCMGYVVFYLFFILIYERGTFKNRKYASARCWIVLLAGIFVIFNQIVISNVSYHKAQIAYEKSYGELMRIADRIDQTPGSAGCCKILVIGALDNSKEYSVNLPPDITGITDGYIIRADDETVGQSALCAALNDYCDKNYKFISGKEKKKFLTREDVKSMQQWPEHDSVIIADDTIVIRLGTEGEE